MAALDNRSDRELIDLLRQGDHAAFTQLYNRYWNKLLAIAYNHTRDKSAAEEIVQNLFVQLWNRKETLEIDDPARYLATAVKFAVFKEYYRRQKREASLNIQLTPTEEHSIEEQIAAKFLQQYIDGIVETLPDKCKLVFKLSRTHHKSNAEIAEELQVTEKTVEMHMTKALKKIRTELNGSGIVTIIVTAGFEHLLRK